MSVTAEQIHDILRRKAILFDPSQQDTPEVIGLVVLTPVGEERAKYGLAYRSGDNICYCNIYPNKVRKIDVEVDPVRIDIRGRLEGGEYSLGHSDYLCSIDDMLRDHGL